MNDDFCQKLQAVIRRNSGHPNASVKKVDVSVMITLHASAEVAFDTVFAPFLQYRPRWEVKSHGWHHIFFTHHGLEAIQYNYNDKRDKRLAKTHRRTGYIEAHR